MPLNNQILGRATIRIDSQVFDTEPGATIRPGGIKNTSRQMTDKHYFSQSEISARLTCKVPVSPETSLRQLQEITGAE
ncbi:MAG: phage tail tube protein, partial [Phycisphaeraceae bacterium]|nr:phage tail tube protein [Phycisphaeraceae bacterium]